MTSSDVETVSVSRPTGSVTDEMTAMTEVMNRTVVSINLVRYRISFTMGEMFLGFLVPFHFSVTFSNDILSDESDCSQY